MISIYIQPDKTQILKGNLKKGKLEVTLCEEVQSYWHIITDKSVESAEELFEELKEITAISYEEIYIILPDFIFDMVNCFEYIISEDLYAQIHDETGKSIDSMYISMPIDTKPAAPAQKTVYAIDKSYVDIFIDAAAISNITLTSIEAASIAFVRTLGTWSLDQPIVEIFGEHAAIINYSPVGGIFRITADNLSRNNLLSSANSETIIKEAFAHNTYEMSKSFKALRTDVLYIVVAPQEILDIPAISTNMRTDNILLPEFVLSDIPPAEQHNWFAAVGTLLQDHTAVYENVPAFLEITSANLLPKEAQIRARNRQWRQIATQICRGTILCMSIILMAAIVGILYFNSIEIPEQLQAAHDNAKTQKAAIQQEIAIIADANAADQHIMEGLAVLLQSKPETCGFVNLTIGANDIQNKKGTKENGKWIQLRAAAKDPIAFQVFQGILLEQEQLGSVIINSINSDGHKIHTADITISRRKEK